MKYFNVTLQMRNRLGEIYDAVYFIRASTEEMAVAKAIKTLRQRNVYPIPDTRVEVEEIGKVEDLSAYAF